MITLPLSPLRRAWLVSFWLVVSPVAGFGLALALAPAISIPWPSAGAPLTAVLLLTGFAFPDLVRHAYRVWNKLAREFSGVASAWLSAIAFYVVFFVVGRGGSRLPLAPPPQESSGWIPRKAESPGRDTVDGPRSSQAGAWIFDYIRWCRGSGNLWALCLLPFILGLAALHEDREHSEIPENLYTLF
ncbi:MAG TPA: hypothetical protein VNO43_19305 [Candidatus Eisenbacteria bacterium]|nr:hypothetical protein [Candidatus Eisenbacteria bacterium]